MSRSFSCFKLGLSLWIALLACSPAHAGLLDQVYRWVSPDGSQPAAASPPAPAPASAPAPAAAAGQQGAPGRPLQPPPAQEPAQTVASAGAALPRAEADPRTEAAVNASLVYGDRLLTEDLVWRGEVLVEGVLTVAPQATLTIEPGTVVRFRRRTAQAPLLVVQGRIVVNGAKESPVLFTSGFATAAAGDWQGIMLLGTEKKNVLENCRVEGAQTALEVLFSTVTLKNVLAERCSVGMRVQDGLLFMDGGGATGCDTGLYLAESESTLRNISVVGNRQGVVAARSSLYLFEGNLSGNQGTALAAEASRVKLQGGALLSNGSGVSLAGCEGTLSGAKLAKNREYGVSLSGSRMRVSGNRITANGENGLVVKDGASVAWDNAIHENAGYDLYNAGVEEFRAPGNWWGSSSPRIFDNNGRGKVLCSPVLGQWPQRP